MCGNFYLQGGPYGGAALWDQSSSFWNVLYARKLILKKIQNVNFCSYLIVLGSEFLKYNLKMYLNYVKS